MACWHGSPFHRLNKATCVGLNWFGSHRLMCLNAWPIWCVLVGGSVSLGFEVIYAQGIPSVGHSLSAAFRTRCKKSQLLLQYQACLHTAMLPTVMIMD